MVESAFLLNFAPLKMKKYIVLCCFAVALMSGAKNDSGVITKENGVTIVNTTTIADDVEGYGGTVPVKIFINKKKVEKIEVLRNQEGPKYMNAVKKQLLHAWDGLTVKEAKAKQVDAVTGATFTSDALIENVYRGLDYYEKHQ